MCDGVQRTVIHADWLQCEHFTTSVKQCKKETSSLFVRALLINGK